MFQNLNPNSLLKYTCYIVYRFCDFANNLTATSLFEFYHLFANDTAPLYLHPDIATKINLFNKEPREICNWFKANKLSVNAS